MNINEIDSDSHILSRSSVSDTASTGPCWESLKVHTKIASLFGAHRPNVDCTCEANNSSPPPPLKPQRIMAVKVEECEGRRERNSSPSLHCPRYAEEVVHILDLLDGQIYKYLISSITHLLDNYLIEPHYYTTIQTQNIGQVNANPHSYYLQICTWTTHWSGYGYC